MSPERAAELFIENLKPQCRVLVACSGGGDSTGLLVALAECTARRPDPGIELLAATVDHGLRAGSTAEVQAVGTLCKRLSIPHYSLVWQGPKPQTGIQAAAREARYRLLAHCATDVGADMIVTAHNLEDQIETHAMKQARNPEATGGIAQSVLLEGRVWVMRPFLHVRRADIRACLSMRAIGWAEDPSNESDRFERVRIRKEMHHADIAPDFAAQASQRRQRAEQTADFLRLHGKTGAATVATIDLAAFSSDDRAHLDAILHLAAFLGGRTHLAGRESRERIAGFLAGTGNGRISAERVIFDRRRSKLYICREKRALEETEVAAGAVALWDNRFRIINRGDTTISVGARSHGESAMPLVSRPVDSVLPKAVQRRLLETEPLLIRGDPSQVSVQPILPQFNRFIPGDLIAVANSLAFLAGLDHFPSLPSRC